MFSFLCLLQPQVRSTKFFEYLCQHVLPQLQDVENPNTQINLLKQLADCGLHTGEVTEAVNLANNVHQRLLV